MIKFQTFARISVVVFACTPTPGKNSDTASMDITSSSPSSGPTSGFPTSSATPESTTENTSETHTQTSGISSGQEDFTTTTDTIASTSDGFASSTTDSPSACFPGEELNPQIPDLQLRFAICDELSGLPTGIESPQIDCKITCEDATSLIELSAKNYGVADMTGLRFFTNLTLLDLSNDDAWQKISVIQDIEDLTSLTYLDLQGNLIATIQGLENLTNLKTLNLSVNMINVIQGLESLENLEDLVLSHNKIETFQGLKTVKKLKNLWIQANPLKTLPGLANFNQLQSLFIYGLPLEDIHDLAEISKTILTVYADNANLTSVDIFEISQMPWIESDLLSLRLVDEGEDDNSYSCPDLLINEAVDNFTAVNLEVGNEIILNPGCP